MITTLRQELIKRKELLKALADEKKKALDKAPEGKLRFNRCGKYTHYYCREKPEDTVGRYISKKNRSFAVQLAQKDYDCRVFRSAQKEIEKISNLLTFYDEDYAESVYPGLHRERQLLVTPFEMPDDEYVLQWSRREYEGKEFKDDSPEYLTAKGERVRSKSEILIADMLNRMDIPYHYEYPLKLRGFGIVYPDFTVLNIRFRREFIWEHLGRMDDPEYLKRALTKIDRYIQNGFIPGSNLILSYESSDHPVSSSSLKTLAEQYLK